MSSPASEGLDFWNARYRAGPVPWDQHGVPVRFAEFLAPAPDLGGFHLVYERTFLCALPPVLHAAYAARMADSPPLYAGKERWQVWRRRG